MYEFISSYLEDAFRPAELVANAREELANVQFDTLVGTGLSGTLVVPLLAIALGVNFMIVRKREEVSHSTYPVEGTIGSRWIFVDDFTSSGATRNRVQAAIAALKVPTEYVGSYYYSTNRFTSVR